ncbi:uncharacterized protein SAPINGB_P005158 [Magnusiomyces paraingens]|uniref:Trafficking protein particle complex subunit 6B n=1 Tax=Magnusiomyces paraingens TaxID=2606893 RepID=A0A5E8BYK4_9ASCO|nr:uncharacterized protein SAPINGB_P005158 [Saprochaete ingens]VVT56574.1 unnamed protein product [Saprochaete ingens]
MASTVQQQQQSQPIAPVRSETSVASKNTTSSSLPPVVSTATAAETKSLVNASAFEYLLIEMVPLARRVVEDVRKPSEDLGSAINSLTLEDKDDSKNPGEKEKEDEKEEKTKDSTTDTTDVNNNTSQVSTPREMLHQYPHMAGAEDADVFFRTELYGFRVGAALAEVLSRDASRLVTQLDVLKFVCKDLWTAVYSKPIDNLKTNHRGIYVLVDNSFRPCERMGSAANGLLSAVHGSKPTGLAKNAPGAGGHHQQMVAATAAAATAAASGAAVTSSAGAGQQKSGTLAAAPFIWFPMGVIRGALSTMGIDASVSFEANQLPAVSFNIHTSTAKR